MGYNVGDIVEYMYFPGVELTVIEIHTIPPSYVSYKLSSGDTVFDSHLTLIKAYQPEVENTKSSTMLIILVIVFAVIMGLK